MYLNKKEFELAVTNNDKSKLEHYRAKRAIFLAAGLGKRLYPITINTPKPLIRVNGVRMIDRSIDACLAAGIEEIYIVRGYLKEQFDQLLLKYPMIKFIDNDNFSTTNNISSAILVKDLFENAYVLEGDLILSNPNLIKPYHYESEVFGIWRKQINDWCLTTDKHGFITGEFPSGNNCHQVMEIYYFTKEDGEKIAKDFTSIQSEKNYRQQYWDVILNNFYKGRYKIKVIPCTDDDISEIDTFEELRKIDPIYQKSLNPS